MSSCEPARTRRALLVALGAGTLLGACNLHPLLKGQEGEKISAELAGVDVRVPRNRFGQVVRNELLDELNPAGLATGDQQYILDVNLDRYKDALAIQLDDTITRYNLTVLARYQLRRKVDNVVLYRSAARRVASYNVVKAPYATLVAEEDAQRRAVVELVKEIRTRLSIYFAGLPA